MANRVEMVKTHHSEALWSDWSNH